MEPKQLHKEGGLNTRWIAWKKIQDEKQQKLEEMLKSKNVYTIWASRGDIKNFSSELDMLGYKYLISPANEEYCEKLIIELKPKKLGKFLIEMSKKYDLMITDNNIGFDKKGWKFRQR